MRPLLLSLAFCVAFALPVLANEAAAPVSTPEQARQMPDNVKQQLEAAGLMMQGMVANMDGKEEEAGGFYRQAIVIYDGMITAEPEHLDALNSRALAKIEIKDPTAAADAEKVIEITTARITAKPDDAKLYHSRAVAYRTLDKYDEATKDYEMAIKLNPERTNWQSDLRAMNAERRLKETLGE